MSIDAGPRYRLHQPLGEGGMGVVHLGTQVSAAGERQVAIKRLAGRAGVDAAARARLVAEARLVFQLTYANICQVLDLGENEAGTFVVMEYVQGDDLGALLDALEDAGGRLDVATAVHVAREVARALDYAHRRVDASGRPLGLVHGDVKPPNILLSVEGEVKLADFGIARALGGAAPGAGILGGTPGFMAPEARTGALDHRADIYSLGATLLRALAGRRPGEDEGPRVEALDGVPDVPRDLRDIVARALAPERAGRWLSAAELERALSAWLARRHPEFTPSRLAEVVRRHVRDGERAGKVRPVLETPDGATQVFDMHTLLDDGGEGAPGEPGEPGEPGDAMAPAPRGRPRTETAAAPARRGRARRAWAVGGVAVLLAALVGLAVGMARMERRAPAAPVAMADADAAADAAADADAAAAAAAGAAAAADAAPAPRRNPRPRVPAPSAPPAAPAAPAAPSAPPGYLTVNATPWARVFVDGHRVADETPAYRVPVAPGRHVVTVEFGDGGARSAPQTVVIDPGQQRTLGFRR